MLTHLDRIAKAVENKKSTKKDDTSITETIELLRNDTSIPRKSELYMLATKLFLKKQNREMFAMKLFENLDDTEHENNERDDDNEHKDSDESDDDNEHNDSDESNDDYEYLHTGVALCVHHFLNIV
ncbi:hypothetical protein QYF36_012554 [Acer negundo]|nr:hypothetical protein QYF36_012554 [Acer negundo]